MGRKGGLREGEEKEEGAVGKGGTVSPGVSPKLRSGSQRPKASTTWICPHLHKGRGARWD